MKEVIFIVLTVLKPYQFTNFQQKEQVQSPERLWGERMRKAMARGKTGKTEWRQTEVVL